MDELVRMEIESQLSLDPDLLLRVLGASQTLGATPGTSRDGRVILENAKRTLRDRLCASELVRTTHDGASNTKVQLVAAVIDVVAGAVAGVSPITVAVLLVKEGLGTLCRDIWTK